MRMETRDVESGGGVRRRREEDLMRT